MEWRDLVMITWSVDPSLVRPLLPAGTTLDLWNGRALLSIVAFRFLDLRVGGIPVPLHQDFEQVNFRFYVKRDLGPEVRPGVVFIKEIVHSTSMAAGARFLYNENYISVPMRHDVREGEHGWASYEFQIDDRWNRVSATRGGDMRPVAADSIESFIKDRPFGYARQRDGSTIEYQVDHPSWSIWPAIDATFDCDVANVYGREYIAPLAADPTSIFIAVGSQAILHPGRVIA